MTTKETGQKPAPAGPTTGAGVRLATEYRLCAIRTLDGRTKRWCFAKQAQAEKHLADLEFDIEHRPACGYRDPWMEIREVTAWRQQ